MNDRYRWASARLKGGALLYAIALAFVIALMISSFMLYSFYGQIIYTKSSRSIALVDNAVSGIEWLMSLNPASEKEEGIMDLFGRGTDSVEYTRNPWGLYEVMTIKACCRGENFTKTVFCGSQLMKDTALFLADRNSALCLSGDTRIKGNCVLPQNGVKPGVADGKKFTRSKLIDGQILKSQTNLPGVSGTKKAYLWKLLKDPASFCDSVILIDRAEDLGDSVVNDFSSKIIGFLCAGNLLLSRQGLYNNIILVSPTLIKVRSDVVLENVILVAPKIIFEKDFSGAVQAFACDSIMLNEGCRLLSPSALVILRNGPISFCPAIVMKKKSSLAGVIFTYQETYPTSNAMRISIEAGAKISGMVYGNSYVDFRGELRGNLIAQVILLPTASGTYENHLLDAGIDAMELSKYSGTGTILEHSRRTIIKAL